MGADRPTGMMTVIMHRWQWQAGGSSKLRGRDGFILGCRASEVRRLTQAIKHSQMDAKARRGRTKNKKVPGVQDLFL